MPQPTPYERLYSFSDYQTVNPTKPLRGSEVDAEFDALKLTTDQVRTNAALIQRDDGQLANQVVSPDSLSAGTLAMIHQGEYLPRGAWAAATVYAVGDLVTYNAATYLCITAHTAAVAFPTDLDLNRWVLIANGALSGQASAINLFEGNATSTGYTLSFTYANSNAALVFVGGVAQIPVQDFTISGTTLTFVVAPPAPSVAGRKNIMVRGTGLEAQLAANAAAAASADAQAFANAASASATSAATSATTATTKAGEASTSATNAAASATSAATSASTATTKASEASTSASGAATSASTATTKASEAAASATSASTSATTATTKASEASASATSASTSATTATTQATNASTSATAASSSASSAASSAASAAAALDSFDDRYLGSKASNPTVDNDGNALAQGALYYRSTAPVGMKVYDGAQWIEASAAQQAALVTYEYVATAAQTSFSGADVNGLALSYIAGGLIVSLNGVILRPGDDYTATNGTTVVLVSGAALNDEVAMYAFSSFQVANTYTQAQIDAALSEKQATLVSGTNLKTVGGASLLGGGDIAVSSFPAGTAMMFVQTAAPTGWTKSTTHDNKALRVVSGTAGSGGSVAFTTAFASGLSAGATTLTIAQIPSHSHTAATSTNLNQSTLYMQYSLKNAADGGTWTSNATGGGASHNHSLPSFAVQYVDVIIATKN